MAGRPVPPATLPIHQALSALAVSGGTYSKPDALRRVSCAPLVTGRDGLTGPSASSSPKSTGLLVRSTEPGCGET